MLKITVCALILLPSLALASFPRTARFLVNEDGHPAMVQAYFATQIADEAYYWAEVEFLDAANAPGAANTGASKNNFARLRRAAGGLGLNVTIELPSERRVWQVELPSSLQTGLATSGIVSTMPGKGADDVAVEDRARTGVSILYWYIWNGAQPAATSQSLQITPLTSLDRDPAGDADERVSVTGPLEFRGCDGCEHADQLFVENYATRASEGLRVNLANVDFGKYADFGCQGTRHPWLNQLIDLGVPFTFEGELSVLTQDLWDANFWTAVPTNARIGLGPSASTLPLVRFLDELLNLDPQAEGAFVSYRDELLTFRRSDAEIIFDLNSAQMISCRR